MALLDDREDPAPTCEPGDITVSQIYTGFLLGRVIAPRGPGPWWEYLAVVRTEVEAVQQAVTIARVHGTRAWRYLEGERYHPIPIPD